MSKKSRKRNKKILGALALLGTGLAMAGRRKKNNMINSADANDGFVDTVSTEKTIMDNMPKTEAPKAVAAPIKKPVVNLGRMQGHGDESGVVGQNKRAEYAQKMRSAVTGVDGPPSVLNPYRKPVRTHNRFNRGINVSYAKGGRVKGAGKAKRGLGRAFTKGRK